MKVIFSGTLFTWLTILTIVEVFRNSPQLIGWMCFTAAAGIEFITNVIQVNKNTYKSK